MVQRAEATVRLFRANAAVCVDSAGITREKIGRRMKFVDAFFSHALFAGAAARSWHKDQTEENRSEKQELEASINLHRAFWNLDKTQADGETRNKGQDH